MHKLITDFAGNRLILRKSGSNLMITCAENGADSGGYGDVASVILDDLDALEVIKAIEQLIRGSEGGDA